MTESSLDAILSVEDLENLAQECGIDVNTLKRLPFFKLLKGILVTYSLNPPAAISLCHQNPLTLHQHPLLDTWYTVADLTGSSANRAIKYIILKQVNDEAAAKAYEWKLTLDEKTALTGGGSINSGVNQYLFLDATIALGLFVSVGTAISLGCKYDPILCRKAKLEVRQTGALGGNQYFDTVVAYAEEE